MFISFKRLGLLNDMRIKFMLAEIYEQSIRDVIARLEEKGGHQLTQDS